jgi:hypothetical protein
MYTVNLSIYVNGQQNRATATNSRQSNTALELTAQGPAGIAAIRLARIDL